MQDLGWQLSGTVFISGAGIAQKQLKTVRTSSWRQFLESSIDAECVVDLQHICQYTVWIKLPYLREYSESECSRGQVLSGPEMDLDKLFDQRQLLQVQQNISWKIHGQLVLQHPVQVHGQFWEYDFEQ